ncbi:MAG: hypothetical protein IPJ66_18735 [Bacteroidetes bacterium]|nr:hypothetical protein [Bacteroidota bacterium]
MKIKKRKLELQEHASLYHSMGCNIFCIGSQVNIYNCHEGNILKSPNHAYNKLFEERQSSEDLNSFDWGNATGVGIILGFNNIVALDIDGSSNLGLVNEILEILNLPLDYEWVMKSGSRIGYHIILKCEDIDPFYEAKNVSNLEEAQLILNAPNFGQLDTNAYYPKFYIRPFCKLEFKWRGNLAMPPSLQVTGERYVFCIALFKLIM